MKPWGSAAAIARARGVVERLVAGLVVFRPIDSQSGLSCLARSDEQDHRCVSPRIYQFAVNISPDHG
jgi:hypothetical protein